MEKKVEYKRTLDERFIITGDEFGEYVFDLIQFESMAFMAGTITFLNHNDNQLIIINISEHQYKRIRKNWIDTKMEVVYDD